MGKITKVNQDSSDNKTPWQNIGRAWINQCKDGKVRINFKIDRGIKVELDENTPVLLSPNTKREGKRDADYRAAIQVVEVVQ